MRNVVQLAGCMILVLAIIALPTRGLADTAPPASKPRIESALQNMLTLDRPNQLGFATIWDGNKYVQCGRLANRDIRCEAAGSLLQPSLERVLTADRLKQIQNLGWRLDPQFGNYVQTFPSNIAVGLLADKILQVLADAYDADVANLEVDSIWVKAEDCPPRNGFSQNLAGMINSAPSMRATAIHACSYKPDPATGPNLPAASAAELFDLYGARVTGEIARLHVNIDRHVFAIFEAGIGYIQCQPQFPPAAIYCEAQSAESWEALASILTPERVAKLHDAGFADPGRAPNYWRKYGLDATGDADIAREVLSILHDVYGYNGIPKLRVITEDSPR